MINLKALIEIAPFIASGEADGWSLGEQLQLSEGEWRFFVEVVQQEKEKLDAANQARDARGHV